MEKSEKQIYSNTFYSISTPIKHFLMNITMPANKYNQIIFSWVSNQMLCIPLEVIKCLHMTHLLEVSLVVTGNNVISIYFCNGRPNEKQKTPVKKLKGGQEGF